VVMKFGGTSVANVERIRNVAAHVKREVDAGNKVAVVVSAACFGTLAVLAPLAFDAGAEPLPLLAWRYMIALVCLELLERGPRIRAAARAGDADHAKDHVEAVLRPVLELAEEGLVFLKGYRELGFRALALLDILG
jgi:hypothetical protein